MVRSLISTANNNNNNNNNAWLSCLNDIMRLDLN